MLLVIALVIVAGIVCINELKQQWLTQEEESRFKYSCLNYFPGLAGYKGDSIHDTTRILWLDALPDASPLH